MKLTTFLFIIALLQVSARSYSQDVNLTVSNTPLVAVLKAVRAQTGYVFFYETKDVQNINVSVQLKKASLNQTLEACLKDAPLDFKIIDKNVVISRKEESLKEKLIHFLTPPHRVTGTVRDESGNPAIGLVVSVKGEKSRTLTDEDGSFTLANVNTNDVLVFSGLAFETQELAVGNRSVFSVSLITKTNQLNTVTIGVNTGYQTLTKERSTGAVVTIPATELEKRYFPSVLDNLEGRVPGLVTYATGLNGSTASRARTTTIRGVSTLRATTSVLVVVDGLPIEGTIDDLNPYDIESVSVLKDAAAASIYGARASNGVIVVTTKKAKVNRTVVEFASDVTIKQKPNYGYLNYFDPSQQVDVESNYYNQFYNQGLLTDPVGTTDLYINTGTSVTPVQYLYYQQKKGLISSDQLAAGLTTLKAANFVQQFRDNALRNEVLQQYNLAVRSRGTRYQSNLVLNFKDSNKGIINADNNALNIFYKGDYTVANWLDIDFGVNTVFNRDKSQYTGALGEADATTPFNVPSYYQLLDSEGNRVSYTLSDYNMYNTFVSTTTGLNSMNFNHLDELNKNFTTTKQLNSRLYVHANFHPMAGIKLSSLFQYEDLRTDQSTYSERDSYFMRRLINDFTPAVTNPTTGVVSYVNLIPTAGGRLATATTRGGNYTFRNQLDFGREYGPHAINAIGGFELRQTYTRLEKNVLWGYNEQLLTNQNNTINYNPTVNYNGTAITIPAVTASVIPAYKPSTNTSNDFLNYFNQGVGVQDVLHRFASGYANVTYTYNRRYNLFGSVRKDVADLFGADVKLKGRPFWSAGLGWNVTNEDFMKAVPGVNYLKLRATYGLTGNVDASTTSFLTATTSTNAVTRLAWAIVSTPANPALRWELTRTTNLGLDFSLFADRLSGTVDVYTKNSDDLLANKLLDASEGYTSLVINNGAATNKGIELNVSYSWFKPGSVSARTILNGGLNQSRVTRVDNVANTAALLTGQAGRAIQQGYPINSLFSYQYQGLNESGNPVFVKADGSTTMTDITAANDIVYSGTLNPIRTLGLTQEFGYKGFSVSALFVYYGGHVMRADQPTFSGVNFGPISKITLDAWTPTHTNTLVPGYGLNKPTSALSNYYYHMLFADKFVQPADFIKLRTVTFSYQFSPAIAKRLAASSVRLRFQLNNPLTVWTKNIIGIDPEANDAFRGGRYLPAQQGYVVGINVNY